MLKQNRSDCAEYLFSRSKDDGIPDDMARLLEESFKIYVAAFESKTPPKAKTVKAR